MPSAYKHHFIIDPHITLYYNISHMSFCSPKHVYPRGDVCVLNVHYSHIQAKVGQSREHVTYGIIPTTFRNDHQGRLNVCLLTDYIAAGHL